MARRYEPHALAEAPRRRGEPTGKTYIWTDGLVQQFMMRDYFEDKIRAGASRAQIRGLMETTRHSQNFLHPPLSELPGYSEATKGMKTIPWYFLREYP